VNERASVLEAKLVDRIARPEAKNKMEALMQE
jgi:hypothetical protein